MPAPLVHIAYARSYLQQRPELSELELLRGTTFPDIRRLANLPRDMTHRYGLKMAEIDAEPDSWKAGMLLHSYLDEAWFAILGRLGEAEESHDQLFWFAAKQAEETFFYGPSRDNQRTAELFHTAPLPQELELAGDPAIIERWNKYLSWKLQTTHTMDDWAHQAERLGRSQAEIQRMLDTITLVRTDAAWKDKLAQLHKELGIAEAKLA